MVLGNIAYVGGDSALALFDLEKGARLMTELRYVYQALPRACLSLVLRAKGVAQSARLHLARAVRSGLEIRSVTPVMYCLPVGALLAVDEGRLERALELYTLAKTFGHISNSHWFKQAACQELDNLHEALAPEAAAAAEARGESWSYGGRPRIS